MGYETDQCRASRDGGIDCMAFQPDPVAPMKIAVQAKLYTKVVSPTRVRDLYGTMQHEGGTLGIMITTSGYGPGSVEFANGKPLHLITDRALSRSARNRTSPPVSSASLPASAGPDHARFPHAHPDGGHCSRSVSRSEPVTLHAAGSPIRPV